MKIKLINGKAQSDHSGEAQPTEGMGTWKKKQQKKPHKN